MALFPRFRYMGSKYRLQEWLHEVFQQLRFDTALDAFSGSGLVSYLLKAMGKQVTTNDFLTFPSVISRGLIENNDQLVDEHEIESLLESRAEREAEKFIQNTFRGVFYRESDLVFLDDAWSAIRRMANPLKQALLLAALLRACIKRQPRGVFTVAGDPQRYKDDRRDLKLSIKEHFIEQVAVYNQAVFSNRRSNRALCGNVFECPDDGIDLVYMDPPYVPRSDDNCYMKRYHFLEGLSCYWQGLEIQPASKVRKVAKPFTPFSYRRTALAAFHEMFKRFADSILVLSYSSNAFPALDELMVAMRAYKPTVEVLKRPHRYHFGTHQAVKRNMVEEYLIIGC